MNRLGSDAELTFDLRRSCYAHMLGCKAGCSDSSSTYAARGEITQSTTSTWQARTTVSYLPSMSKQRDVRAKHTLKQDSLQGHIARHLGVEVCDSAVLNPALRYEHVYSIRDLGYAGELRELIRLDCCRVQ